MKTDSWSFDVVAGPDTGRTMVLPHGRHRFGRERAGLVIDDPTIEVHHLAIDVADGVRCAQLSGRVPVRVDGRAIAGFVDVPDGAFVEVGVSLLRFARTDRSDDRHDSVIRRWPVTLGIGDICVDAEVGPDGRTDPCSLPFDEQVTFDARRRRAGVPVVIDLERTPRLGVTGPHRVAAARAIVEAVRGARRPAPTVMWPDLADEPADAPGNGTIMVCDAARFRSASRSLADRERADLERGDVGPAVMIVLADDVTELPAACTARLSVGARWRGTYVADTETGFDAVVPLHVAGRSAQRSGPIVAQQVARPGAEFGRGIGGIPQTARGERQAAAPDAGVELVAHSGEQRDLLVEPRSPRLRQPVPILGGRRPVIRE